jgi:hypothetical protein
MICFFKQRIEHHLEMRAMFMRKPGIGDGYGVHLRRKTDGAHFGGQHHISELHEAGLADGGKKGGFIFEVPVRGRPRNTQLFADLAQCERVNPFPLDQFEPTLDQRGA